MRHDKRKIDRETQRYIANLRFVQGGVMLAVFISFIVFARIIIVRHSENLKEVAVSEVQEAMQETVHNIAIRIDNIRERIADEAKADLLDMEKKMREEKLQSPQEMVQFLNEYGKSQLERKIEAVCISREKKETVYIAADTRAKTLCREDGVRKIYEEAPLCRQFTTGEMDIVLFVRQSQIDELAKEEIHKDIHSEVYVGNQYVWVNEVLNMNGGDNYAIRRIHPNLKESEGEYLSTSMQDVKGNYPYERELEEIREYGYVFHSYYFKNLIDDRIAEKYSYAMYYEPFQWIIATGETLEEVYAYADEVSRYSINYSVMLLILFIGLIALTFAAIVKICSRQAQDFQMRLMKQSEVYEDIYKTMPIGLMRLYVTGKEITLVNTNPNGLKMLGLKNEEECRKNLKKWDSSIVDAKNAEKLTESCFSLKEQWDSNVAECEVRWRDGELHRIRVRDTLIHFDGNARFVQRILQDITAEYHEQEQRLREAEERATLDHMTGLKNKRAIEITVRAMLEEAEREQRSAAVGFVDIDNFRDYNTRYGHAQGDEVIKYVASVLRDHVPGVAGRNGGDEFVFCCVGVSCKEISEAMERVYEKLHEGNENRMTGEKIPTPCSIGIVFAKEVSHSYEEMLEQSDAAMYEAKERGKDTYVILKI